MGDHDYFDDNNHDLQPFPLWETLMDWNKLRKYWAEIATFIVLLCAIWQWGMPFLEHYFRMGKRFLYLFSFLTPILALWGFNKVNKDRVVREAYPTSTMRNRRNVSGRMKKYVAAGQKWRCAACSSLLSASYEVDHVLPLYRGGTNSVENLQALCPNCHGSKTVRDAILG